MATITFDALRAAASESSDSYYTVRGIMSAEINVADTEIEKGCKFTAEEAESFALATLGELCAFNEKLAAFFAPLGLKF